MKCHSINYENTLSTVQKKNECEKQILIKLDQVNCTCKYLILNCGHGQARRCAATSMTMGMSWLGGEALTRGDELTGGTRFLTRAKKAVMVVYMEVKLMVTWHRSIDRSTNQPNIEQSASGRWKADICNNELTVSEKTTLCVKSWLTQILQTCWKLLQRTNEGMDLYIF